MIASNIEAIAQVMRGLHVQCKYEPGARTADGRARASILEGEQISKRGRTFQIKVIKMAADVDQFEYGPEKKKYTVYDYFTQGTHILTWNYDTID